YVRYSQGFPLSGTAASFPTIAIDDLDGITIGPAANLPQSRLFNEYTLGDSMSWTHGRHTVKFGGQYYWYISPSVFLQNQRGQYGYTSTTFLANPADPTSSVTVNSLEQLVNDLLPSKANVTLQGLGNGFFSGNARNYN